MMAQTPNPNRRLRFSMQPTLNPAPFYTPKPEKRSFDLRWTDVSSSRCRPNKDEGVPVQVVLRCRPLNEEEQKLNAQSVISCNELKKEVVISQIMLTKQADRTFTFDKVFGPDAQQRTVYDKAISPIVNEVLEGYNCTVFAFGQTGTGKTYTMEGDMKSRIGDLSENAGVIPRAVKQIFEILEERNIDYSMKVTFLELYNEEITDLLAMDEQVKFSFEEKPRKQISLLEDGKGGEIIRGLEEIAVFTPNEIYNLLEIGSTRRRSVDTAINKQSSRSHVIFSINIHIKEEKFGDEELLKFGRLNLVDLAGSENIARSGAKESKAREAGEINKSLLTLGRVITALTEHSGHIPYRNSKLTRLLRESLGGKAKTCIIATISPCINSLEETLMTLDYASRARNIKNKPEVNQKVSKSVVLKDLHHEIEKMKQDVKAAREKNGIYIAQERFIEEEEEKKAMREKIKNLEKECMKFKQNYFAEKMTLENTQRDLQELQEFNSKMKMELKEKDFIISNLFLKENEIVDHAKDLCNKLEIQSHDISHLSSKIERQYTKEGTNKELIQNLSSQLDNGFKLLKKRVDKSVVDQRNVLQSTQENISSYFSNKSMEIETLRERIEGNKYKYETGTKNIKEIIYKLKNKSIMDFETMESSLASQITAIDHFMTRAVSESKQVLLDIHESLTEHSKFVEFSSIKHEQMLKKSLKLTQEISETTLDFFNDVKKQSIDLIMKIEDNQIKVSSQLDEFQRSFEEESDNQENAALDQIAGILSNLKAKKNIMVSDAVDNLNQNMNKDNNKILLEINDMYQISKDTEKDWIKYTDDLENQFENDRAENDEIRDESLRKVEHCLKRVDESNYHLLHAQYSIDNLNKSYYKEMDHYNNKRRRENRRDLKRILSVSSENQSKFQDSVSDILISSQRWNEMDMEAKKKFEENTSISKDCLKSLKKDHAENISSIRSMKSKCIKEDYLDGSPLRNMNREVQLEIPSLDSIEDLRSNLENMIAEFQEKGKLTSGEKEEKSSARRSPLTQLNHNDD